MNTTLVDIIKRTCQWQPEIAVYRLVDDDLEDMVAVRSTILPILYLLSWDTLIDQALLALEAGT